MKLTLKDIVLIALLAALLLVSQVTLAVLPNIELTSFLILIYTRFFRKKTLYIIYVFVLLEGIIYGFGMWWFCYLYVWTVLWAVVMLLRKEQSALFFALVSGMFGLAFGTLCSVPYFITGGVNMGLSWIVSGLPFDITHGISNFVIALLLFRPVNYVFAKVYQTYYQN